MNLEFEVAHRTSPSPLNGERAGVRGENGPTLSLWFMLPMRARMQVEALPMNLESSRLTHPGSWSPHTSGSGDVCHP